MILSDGPPARPVFLFGANGNLGTALHRALRTVGRTVVPVPREKYSDWADRTRVRDLLAQGGDIVFANGLTDPRLPVETLNEANVQQPLCVVAAACGLAGVRFLTFGSALQDITPLAAGNPYLSTKRLLSERFAALASQDARVTDRLLHIRLHTLYGGRPTKHLFLGQLFAALANEHPFRMSEGRQVRDYYHVDEIAPVVVSILDRIWTGWPTMTIGSGQADMLRDIAKDVATAFGRGYLLKIGESAAPAGEIFDLPPSRMPAWIDFRPQPAIPGIIHWFEACGLVPSSPARML